MACLFSLWQSGRTFERLVLSRECDGYQLAWASDSIMPPA